MASNMVEFAKFFIRLHFELDVLVKGLDDDEDMFNELTF